LRSPVQLALLLLACLADLTACGGGGTYRGGEFSDDEAAYRVGAPGDGWRQVDVEGQNDLAWAHDELSAVIQVNASCDPALDIPLPALRNHLLIGFTDRHVEREERVEVATREALRTHLRARLDGVPRELVLTVLKKDGCVYDLALVAPPGERYDAARRGYDALVAGFDAGSDGGEAP